MLTVDAAGEKGQVRTGCIEKPRSPFTKLKEKKDCLQFPRLELATLLLFICAKLTHSIYLR